MEKGFSVSDEYDISLTSKWNRKHKIIAHITWLVVVLRVHMVLFHTLKSLGDVSPYKHTLEVTLQYQALVPCHKTLSSLSSSLPNRDGWPESWKYCHFRPTPENYYGIWNSQETQNEQVCSWLCSVGLHDNRLTRLWPVYIYIYIYIYIHVPIISIHWYLVNYEQFVCSWKFYYIPKHW